ncbi:hypothetical protein ALTERO38_51575 [Alteromonas sp. 38]|nr:hypothetical protein ALTER154_80120 [Alteromonas sp. 154]VXB78806.1 hypothetical protein ALTERO38_51575 [Alteromonas sp. 38]
MLSAEAAMIFTTDQAEFAFMDMFQSELGFFHFGRYKFKILLWCC